MNGKSGQVLAVNLLFWTLAWIFVGLRVYVRAVKLQSFGTDDWMILVTLGFFTAYLICQLGGIVHGTGQLRKDITDRNAQIALEFWWFCELLYICATGALKVAIGLFLLRITTIRAHIWIIRLLSAATILVCTIYFFICLFQCTPVSYWWDLNPNHHGHCISATPLMITGYVASTLNSMADWAFGILPIFIVSQLHMKTHTKFIVAGILSFAAIGCLATLIRMPYVKQFANNKGEWLWNTTDLAIWSTVEVGVGIVAACLPTLRPLLQPVLDKFGIEISSSGGTNTTPKWGLRYSSKKTNSSRLGTGMYMNDLDTKKEGKVTTLVTSKKTAAGSDAGSEDGIFISSPAWNTGISRSVHVSSIEESTSKAGEEDAEALVYERV